LLYLSHIHYYLLHHSAPYEIYTLSLHDALPIFSINTKIIASFFAGLFYLLNLGTLQTFYAPFETFIAFYASLPWLLLSVFVYLEDRKSTRLNSSHVKISYAVFCSKKKKLSY